MPVKDATHSHTRVIEKQSLDCGERNENKVMIKIVVQTSEVKEEIVCGTGSTKLVEQKRDGRTRQRMEKDK